MISSMSSVGLVLSMIGIELATVQWSMMAGLISALLMIGISSMVLVLSMIFMSLLIDIGFTDQGSAVMMDLIGAKVISIRNLFIFSMIVMSVLATVQVSMMTSLVSTMGEVISINAGLVYYTTV